MVGLGILGGGVATANFLIKHGAKLKVTDMRGKEVLSKSLRQLPKSIVYTLGKHLEKDFRHAEIIVANPAVPRYGEWIRLAEQLGKVIYNDLTLFLTSIRSMGKDVIAITGTRGKTTTTLWTHHLILGSIVGGNIPETGPLKIINKKGNPFILETSSFQLEYVTKGLPAPHIALITNLYQDHLNRHKTMKEYVRAKAGIFLNQTKEDFVILNFNNEYTKNFLALKPKSAVLYFSTKQLQKGREGIYMQKGDIYTVFNGKKTFIMKSPFDTDFLNENLMGALLASFLYLGDWSKIIPRVSTLPDVPMRRQVIKKTRNSVVVNDSAGTSPDATIALLAEYKKIPKNQKILITGGTDKQLDFSVWPNHIKKELMSSNVYFLNGSATQKMVSGLKKVHFFNKGEKPNRYEDLKDIVEVISRRKGKKTILFSPSSASFEKFKNEFDRGNQFSRFVRTLF